MTLLILKSYKCKKKKSLKKNFFSYKFKKKLNIYIVVKHVMCVHETIHVVAFINFRVHNSENCNKIEVR